MARDAAVRVRMRVRCSASEAWQILQFLKGEGEIPPPPLTPLEQMQVWHLRRSLPLARTNADFAEALGMSHATFYSRKKELRLPDLKTERERQERERLAALLGQDLSYTEIARRLGICKKTLYNKRRKYGL